jgi:hypothetical protein
MTATEDPRGRARQVAVLATVAAAAAAVGYRLVRPVFSRWPSFRRRRDRSEPQIERVTLDGFQQLRPGMEEADLIQLLGAPTTEANRSQTPLAVTRTLIWRSRDGQAMVHVVVQNGQVVGKAERGLQ